MLQKQKNITQIACINKSFYISEQSVKPMDDFEKSKDKIFKKYAELLKGLSKN